MLIAVLLQSVKVEFVVPKALKIRGSQSAKKRIIQVQRTLKA